MFWVFSTWKCGQQFRKMRIFVLIFTENWGIFKKNLAGSLTGQRTNRRLEVGGGSDPPPSCWGWSGPLPPQGKGSHVSRGSGPTPGWGGVPFQRPGYGFLCKVPEFFGNGFRWQGGKCRGDLISAIFLHFLKFPTILQFFFFFHPCPHQPELDWTWNELPNFQKNCQIMQILAVFGLFRIFF